MEPVIAAADMVFLSVNTPTKARGIDAGLSGNCFQNNIRNLVVLYGHDSLHAVATLTGSRW